MTQDTGPNESLTVPPLSVPASPRPTKPLRFIYAGNFTQTVSTEAYVAECLQKLGHQVLRIQENQYSPDEVLEWCKAVNGDRPLVFLSSKCQLRTLEFRPVVANPMRMVSFLRSLRQDAGVACSILWIYDLMREEFSAERYKWSTVVSAECDLFLATDSGLVNDPWIKNGSLLRQGYPGPTEALPGQKRNEYAGQVVFLGDLYGRRQDWATAMRRQFQTHFKILNGVYGPSLFDVGRSARIVVGPPYPWFDGYWSNRLYLMVGYGCCYATPTIPGMLDEGWIPNTHYIDLPRDPTKAAMTLAKYQSEGPFRQQIRVEGQRFVLANHTLMHRVKDLVKKIEVSLENPHRRLRPPPQA